MTPNRHPARILAMQMLCQLDVRGDEALADMQDFLEEEEPDEKVRRYAAKLTRGCWSDRAELDRRVSAASEHWSVDRISVVERNVMRVAVAEMLGTEVPPKVALNEAIEIGREYGGADTPKFINGVLNGVYQRIREETDHGAV